MTWGSGPGPDKIHWWEWTPFIFVILFAVLAVLAAIGKAIHDCQ